jgi:uncharacterized protein (DUF924 family)
VKDSSSAACVDPILDFWFGAPSDPDYGKRRKIWFTKDDAFDAECRTHFLADHERAAAGELDHLQSTPRGALALILALDQFPRNMFRGTPRMYATDALALATARRALDGRFDEALGLHQRLFVYLPFEHSEDLADQRRFLALFQKLADMPESDLEITIAARHFEIIERFGRFPHRNAILGRQSTPEEEAFLLEPNSSF